MNTLDGCAEDQRPQEQMESIACCINSDSPFSQECVDNRSVPRETVEMSCVGVDCVCRSALDCPMGSYCDDDTFTCIAKECELSADCPQGLICINFWSVIGLNSDIDRDGVPDQASDRSEQLASLVWKRLDRR